MTFNEVYKSKISDIDKFLLNHLSSYEKCASSELVESMKYSVLNGGKRIRSILCTEICTMLGGNKDIAMPFACAIELIHAYSLVHDDLPAMDNDDFRRGQLSCHKKYGEAMGILCGDSLLNCAFELMLKHCNDANSVEAAKILADSSGANGMISGQVKDLASNSGIECTESSLIDIIEKKTMAIIKSAIIAGAILAKASDDVISSMKEFAYNLGLAFQIRDDFEDIKEDEASINDSPNFINALGEKIAMERLKFHSDNCKTIISDFQNNSFIMDLLNYLFY